MPRRRPPITADEPLRMTEREYRRLEDEMIGICIACHAHRPNTEPDVTDYPCDSCDGRRTVHGVDDLLQSDRIFILGDDDQ